MFQSEVNELRFFIFHKDLLTEGQHEIRRRFLTSGNIHQSFGISLDLP